MSTKNILITVPDLTRMGGVAALFNILKLDRNESINYFSVHGHLNLNKLRRIFELLSIYIRFTVKCFNIDIVHLNPSLNNKSFIRDSIFAFISKIFRKKLLIYWHGWDKDFEKKINEYVYLQFIFKLSFLKADTHVVLGSCFKEVLINWEVQPENVKIESNCASDDYLKGAIIHKSISPESAFNILFIARLEKQKGIYETLETLKLLKRDFNVHLTIAGFGSEFNKIQEYINENALAEDVSLLGNIVMIEKHKALTNAQLLLFPTVHHEGMPISILEGMLYGLPIISRNVGGIPDWVENEIDGFLFSSNNPVEYAECIARLIQSPILFEKIRSNNIEKSKKLFTPEVVSKRLFNYYEELFNY